MKIQLSEEFINDNVIKENGKLIVLDRKNYYCEICRSHIGFMSEKAYEKGHRHCSECYCQQCEEEECNNSMY